ncbi:MULTISPECIES: NusG domain II-containing protein [Gracilibacillus]|uniref:NusG domain II-containing protein n=1 Tax=Gracilibacillus TaxID=74385 RepID=UPI0008242F41|nr:MULTISPECIES: NusG domain II-containing protein [Gracilibacillus]
MRNFMKMLKPFDIVIIVVLIFISLIPLTYFSIMQAQQKGDTVVAEISRDGEVLREITLTGNEGNEEFTIEGEGDQYNRIEVDGERIRIKEDNSPDQVGVRMGWKDKPGETIVCLPHKLLIELSSENEDNGGEEDVIISH